MQISMSPQAGGEAVGGGGREGVLRRPSALYLGPGGSGLEAC